MPSSMNRLAPVTAPTPPQDLTLFDKEVAHWFQGMDFTADWLNKKVHHWFVHLDRFRDQPVEVLEVGSWEGRSAVAFLCLLPKSRITCIDYFRGAEAGPETEARFDANLARFHGRVEKINDYAGPALDRLYQDGRLFEVVYLDAAKKRDETFAQSALAWPLLKVGGVLIWDDFRWGSATAQEARPDLNWDDRSASTPGDGIRTFCRTFADSIEVLHQAKQMIVQKIAAWPARDSRGSV